MNKKCKVSIIMPAFNAEKNISFSIDSALNQTYRDFELIIINDASKDDTLEVVKSYNDDRIKIIDLKQNGGVANARNTGIKEATGEYVAFLDSDDLWLPEKLEKQLLFAESNKHEFTFTDYYVLDTLDSKTGKEKIRKHNKSVTFNQLKKSNQIGCLTVLVKSEIIKRNLMPLIRHEDYATWLQILKNEKIIAYNQGEPLSRYRVHGESLSGDKFKSAKWHWEVYRDFLGMNILSSVYNFIFYTVNGVLKRV